MGGNPIKQKEEELENLASNLLKGNEYLAFCLRIRNLVQTAFDEGRKYQGEIDAGMTYLAQMSP